MKIKVIADSSCDKLEMDGIDFTTVPLKICTDEKEYVDNAELDVDKMIEELRAYKGRSFSSCPNVNEWHSACEGADEVYMFAITSGISGSYNSAMSAKRLCEEENPHVKVKVFDTLSAGAEILLQIEKVCGYIKEGRGFEDICRLTEEYMKNTKLLFVLESLHNFAQNGRVSKVAAAAAGFLGIKVLGKASDTGTLELIDKYKGESKAQNAVIEQMNKLGYSGGRVNIGHTQNEKGAEKLKTLIKQTFANADIATYPMRGLCSYYAEKGGLLIGFES